MYFIAFLKLFMYADVLKFARKMNSVNDVGITVSRGLK